LRHELSVRGEGAGNILGVGGHIQVALDDEGLILGLDAIKGFGYTDLEGCSGCCGCGRHSGYRRWWDGNCDWWGKVARTLAGGGYGTIGDTNGGVIGFGDGAGLGATEGAGVA
jgi:hypothetical protein